jgi:hypothetical protein
MTELIYSCYANKGASPEGLERKIIKVNTSIYTRHPAGPARQPGCLDGGGQFLRQG